MLCFYHGGGRGATKGHGKLLEVMDMSVALIVVIVSWVHVYVQTQQTAYVRKKKKETGLESSALFNDQYIFFN